MEIKSRDQIDGFTLLEVMIALAIIAIALTAIFHMQAQTILMANSTQFYSIAPLLAQQKMAEIESGLVKGQDEGNGDFGERFNGYGFHYSVEPVHSEALGSAAGDLKRIDITVSINNGESVYALRSYCFLPP